MRDTWHVGNPRRAGGSRASRAKRWWYVRCVLWASVCGLLALVGCSGGGGRLPHGEVTAPVKLTIEWGERSRVIAAPSSALSCRVELFAATSPPAGSATHAWLIERATLPAGYVQSWMSPTAARIGPWRLALTFYAEQGGQGAVVAAVNQVITLDANGDGAGFVTLVQRVATVAVDDRAVVAGERAALSCVARDAFGAVVAVTPASVFWTVLQGAQYVRLAGDEVEGLSAGSALVQARVDGVASRAATVTVMPKIDPPPTLTVMPLGDSITVGSGSNTSYRYYLWKQLRAAGYTGLDFVGSQTGIGAGRQPLDHDWDEDHEGHAGWTADHILNGYAPSEGKLRGSTGWAMTYRPDIALILLGANDLGYGRSPQAVIADLEEIIATLRQANPSVCIALAHLTPARSDYAAIPNMTPEFHAYLLLLNANSAELNHQMTLSAARLSSAQSPVAAVDLYTILNPVTDVPDGIHPNNAGCQKMAAAWYPVVAAFLNARR